MSDINREVFSQMVQRFAISALSRERKDEAMNEEMLVGKYTGEFYIKSKDGIVISTDILNRTKVATENAIRVAELMGITGELYKVEFEELQLPNYINYSTNLLATEPIQIPVNSKEFLFHIDLDEYDIVNKTIKNVFTYGKIDITITAHNNAGLIKTFRFESDLSNINYKLFSLKEVQNYINNINDKEILNDIQPMILINDITITKDSRSYTDNSSERTILLHNIFVSVNN